MAQEIKSIDVENDAEEFYVNTFQKFGWELKSSQRVYNQDTIPLGSISYENVTYIHSQTDTVDFTKLVFERDTKMANYREIRELEEEFWELGEIVSEGRPYMPPHAETMEGWARHFEPDLRSGSEKKRIHIIFGIIIAVLSVATLAITHSEYSDLALIGMYLSLFGIGLSIICWRLAVKISKIRALNIATKPRSSEYRAILENIYDGVISQIRIYDQSVERMREIVREANELLD